MPDWTTTANVAARTPETVTAAQLEQAHAIIESALGIDRDASAPWLKARDLRILGRAVEYQAAYVKANPSIFTERDLVAISQPDLSIVYGQGGAETTPAWLAPMAAMVLRKFRYSGPRTVQLESTITQPGAAADDDYGDDGDGWEPI